MKHKARRIFDLHVRVLNGAGVFVFAAEEVLEEVANGRAEAGRDRGNVETIFDLHIAIYVLNFERISRRRISCVVVVSVSRHRLHPL
jgi:hypothetical protein